MQRMGGVKPGWAVAALVAPESAAPCGEPGVRTHTAESDSEFEGKRLQSVG